MYVLFDWYFIYWDWFINWVFWCVECTFFPCLGERLMFCYDYWWWNVFIFWNKLEGVYWMIEYRSFKGVECLFEYILGIGEWLGSRILLTFWGVCLMLWDVLWFRVIRLLWIDWFVMVLVIWILGITMIIVLYLSVMSE